MGDLLARFDEAAQDRLFAHDLGIEVDVGCDGDARDERVDVGRSADAGEFAPALEFSRDGDRIGRLIAAVETLDDAEDEFVGRAVEVSAEKHLGGRADGVLAQQHGTEDALFCNEVLGWHSSGMATRVVRLGSCRIKVGYAHKLAPCPLTLLLSEA